MRIGRTMIGLLAMTAPLPALAQQAPTWRTASSSGQQTAFLDVNSIVRDGDKVRIMREVRSNPPMAFEDGTRFDRLGSLIEFDCQARTLRTLTVYAKLGEQELGRGEGSGEVEQIAEGSTAHTDLRAACFNEWPR